MQTVMSILRDPGAFARRILVTVLILIVLIVGLIWLTSGGSLPDDGEPVAVSTDEALAFLERSTTALKGAGAGGSISLTVTEEELTSFIAVGSRLTKLLQTTPTEEQVAELEALTTSGEVQGLELIERWEALMEERDESGWRRLVPDDFKLELTLEEPEVRFLADGSVIVRGSGEWGFFSVPARVVAVPKASRGDLEFDFVEGQLGRVGLSETVFDLVGDGIERLLLAGNDVAEISALDVRDGVMSFTARLGSAGG